MLERINFGAKRMTKYEYKPVHDELVGKLVLLQQKARFEGVGMVVLFEGWSGAGKGSRISDLVYELDARSTKVHVTKDINPKAARKFAGVKWGVLGEDPLMKQFWQALCERGEITFYDRGWYTAAAEKVVFGLTGADPEAMKKLAKKIQKLPAAEAGAEEARMKLHGDTIAGYRQVAHSFEQMLVDDGYIVVKLFVHVSKKAQRERLESLHNDPNTSWRVDKQKLQMTKYYDQAYKIYDQLLEDTDFEEAPWTIVNGEDRHVANIQIAQALVNALENKLAEKPDTETEDTRRKTSESSDALSGGKQSVADEASSGEADEKVAAYERLAAVQSSLAPRESRFPIMENYPTIDHSMRKPSIDDRSEYETRLKQEQKRLRKLQEEMYKKRVPLMIMYEGWDAAGKGGNIKRVAQSIDARGYDIFTSPAPTKVELAHPHLWRYWTRLPKAGHVGIYDRSWYGRVLVERVEGFATPEQWGRAYDEINAFEQQLVQWGAILLKFWVDITPEEQLARFEARASDPNRSWKLTDEDWRNREKYPLYKNAADDMFRLTSTTFAPWIILESDCKHFARIQALETINQSLEARLHV